MDVEGETMKEGFAGTWKLVDYVFIRDDGTVRKPWGEDVSGLLIYSPDGYMSANLSPAPRKDPATPHVLSAGPDRQGRRASRYISYAGRYTVNETAITHHVEVSLFPGWVGLPQLRYYELTADRLVLRTPQIPRLGKRLVGQLTWKRAR